MFLLLTKFIGSKNMVTTDSHPFKRGLGLVVCRIVILFHQLAIGIIIKPI